MRDVDFVNGLLPDHLRLEWIRKYHDMDQAEKIQPFRPFMKYLERERGAVARLAEYQPRRRRTIEVPKTGDRVKGQTHHGAGTGQDRRQFCQCAFHRRDTIKHKTIDCKEFQKLPISGEGGKFELLKQVNACFVCFGNHPQQKCPNRKPCSLCGRDKHHFLLCKSGEKREGSSTTSQAQTGSAPQNEKEEDRKTDYCAHAESASHVTKGAGLALYPIQEAKVCESGKNVTIFCDGGSNTTYITHQATDRIKAKKLNRFALDVTTMGNVEKTYNTRQYQFTLRTDTGKKVIITALGMDRITGPVSKLDTIVLADLFPGYDVDSLQGRTDKVDVLLGCDYFGLFPKSEEAKSGENLSIMKGDFGVCLQGTHPILKEEIEHDSNLAKTIHISVIKHEVYHVRHDTHPEFQSDFSDPVTLVDIGEKNTSFRLQTNVAESFTAKNQGRQVENFISGEEIRTEFTPRCGSYRCGKCPTVGHTYSFKEEQELRMIQENLENDSVKQCWVTSYPWLVDPATLLNNYGSALATLKNTERTLSKDEWWAETYQKQMQDMIERGVAQKLSQKELQEWSGPRFYISHLAVVNTRSHSPVRIVFNSSQVCQGISLNSCLAKGPDCYMNNLIGILLRWREE